MLLSGARLALLGRRKAPGIRLSSNTLAENSAQGTAVGTLSVVGGTGTYTFTLSDSAGSRLQVAGGNGVNLQAGATVTDYETATSHNITVHADNGAGSTFDRTFTIFVLDVVEGSALLVDVGQPFLVDVGSSLLVYVT